MQLQAARARFEAQGLQIASVSYDNEATLRAFAKRSGVTYVMCPHAQALCEPGWPALAIRRGQR